MKTIEQWLTELPDECRDKALKNMDAFDAKYQVDSLDAAVLSAFDWEQSPEGHNYWSAIHDKL